MEWEKARWMSRFAIFGAWPNASRARNVVDAKATCRNELASSRAEDMCDFSTALLEARPDPLVSCQWVILILPLRTVGP